MACEHEKRCLCVLRSDIGSLEEHRRRHDRRTMHISVSTSAEESSLVETCKAAQLLHTTMGPKEIGMLHFVVTEFVMK